jgi:6-phosphogluconolactonase
VSELDNLGENNSGGVAAYRIGDNYSLKLINHVLTYGANPCHVSVSPDGKLLVASNYTGGSLSVFRVEENGELSPLVQRIQDEGSGPFPERQTAPHVHSTQFVNQGKLLFAADLGIDQLKVFSVNPKAEIPLTAYSPSFVKLPPGSGPRHFAFSPDGRYIYVVNELASTITVLMKYGEDWKDVQDIKTLPKDFKGESWAADIHLSADGRFVYASNRGHNSLVVFKRDQVNGKLELIETIPVEGNWPRNFAIDPTGQFILVANQKSDDVTVFKINPDSGKLKYTGIKVSNHSPVCLQFLK